MGASRRWTAAGPPVNGSWGRGRRLSFPSIACDSSSGRECLGRASGLQPPRHHAQPAGAESTQLRARAFEPARKQVPRHPRPQTRLSGQVRQVFQVGQLGRGVCRGAAGERGRFPGTGHASRTGVPHIGRGSRSNDPTCDAMPRPPPQLQPCSRPLPRPHLGPGCRACRRPAGPGRAPPLASRRGLQACATVGHARHACMRLPRVARWAAGNPALGGAPPTRRPTASKKQPGREHARSL